jgi:hypothetical protein
MTKDEVIAILKKSKGYVSGEEISQTLGISRAAVNSRSNPCGGMAMTFFHQPTGAIC